MKAAAVLALVPAASAFIAPAGPKMARGRSMQMNFGYEEGGRPVGGVQFFPDSAKQWDPLGLADTEEKFNKYQGIEIKHGRIAMLAILHYVATANLGYRIPGFEEVPFGYTSTTALPLASIAQIVAFTSALELLAPQKDDKVPGNTQPETDTFAAPGDIEIRTKEINNGRLAMISIAGIWAGEYASGGANPFQSFAEWIGA